MIAIDWATQKVDALIEIICGTNRPGALSRELSKLILQEFKSINATANILDLADLPLEHMSGKTYWKDQPEKLAELNNRVVSSDGLVVVTPEYNGSFPGVLKLFIDHWPFPKAFHFRPVWLVGIGGRFGGLRAIEQLSQVFAYRQAHIFPFNLVITGIDKVLKDGTLTDKFATDLLKKNSRQFVDYVAHMKRLPLIP